MSDNVLVLGATSGIARALCAAMAKRGCRLVLAGRDTNEMARLAQDLIIRFETDVYVEEFEATDFDGHDCFLTRCIEHFGGNLTGVIACYGYLAPQAQTQVDFFESRRTIEVNFVSVVSILNLAANHLETRQGGYIAAISSVAGDRGRQSNYTYGSSKAGLTTYLQGLRNRLYHAGVHVLTIKPGFVATPMTDGLLRAGSPLVASPEQVAADIDRAIVKRKNVVYTPWFWHPIMALIKAAPEWIFKRLKL